MVMRPCATGTGRAARQAKRLRVTTSARMGQSAVPARRIDCAHCRQVGTSRGPNAVMFAVRPVPNPATIREWPCCVDDIVSHLHSHGGARTGSHREHDRGRPRAISDQADFLPTPNRTQSACLSSGASGSTGSIVDTFSRLPWREFFWTASRRTLPGTRPAMIPLPFIRSRMHPATAPHRPGPSTS